MFRKDPVDLPATSIPPNHPESLPKHENSVRGQNSCTEIQAGLIQEKQRPPGQTGRSADFQSAWVRDRRIVEPRPDGSRRSVFLNQP